jgi:predicted NAD/FAD-binding protein
VRAVTRAADGLTVAHDGGCERFDQVVMACHSDQALSILGFTASDAQREVLSAIRYQPNRALLHTDPALLPRDRKLWSAWNYFAGQRAGSPAGRRLLPINKLQPLPFETPVVVTLNPAREPDPAKVIAEFDYAHPIFDGRRHRRPAAPGRVQGEGGLAGRRLGQLRLPRRRPEVGAAR